MPKKNAPAKKFRRKSVTEIPKPLTPDEVSQFKQLPVLTPEQIGRVLQKTIKQVYEMSRARAKRPLPVFKSGNTIGSTWDRIIVWRDARFAERAA